ncbi:MAG: hypothetical protein R3D85_07470 [Paracoccaceae bacterium]
MRDLIFAAIMLALPLATAWALRRALPARLRFLSGAALVMAGLVALLVWASFGCTTEAQAWASCRPDALTPLFNSLRPLLLNNVTAVLLLCPAALIFAGINTLIRRERHDS